MPNIWDYLYEFSVALEAQLKEDAKRWGNTWLQRLPEGQERRIWEHVQSYFDMYFNGNQPIPWLKIAGLALIAYTREKHPELWNK